MKILLVNDDGIGAPGLHAMADALFADHEVYIVAPDKDNLELQEWYIERSALSGKIVIDLSNQAAKYDQTERTIQFENAQCVAIAEHYEIDAPYRHLFEFEFMAEALEIDENTFQ